MIFLYAFLLGGFICAMGELIMQIFKLTPGHITGIFVVIGTFLDFSNFYDFLIKHCGAGALLPITSFGHSLSHASFQGGLKEGFLGFSRYMFDTTANGIVWTLIAGVLIGLFFRPKS